MSAPPVPASDGSASALASALTAALSGGPAVMVGDSAPSGSDDGPPATSGTDDGPPATPGTDDGLPADAVAVVPTSGSTGTAKAVVLTAAAVRASAEATHDRLGGPGSWTLTLPAHYVAGVMVIARTLVARTALHHLRADLTGTHPALGTPGRHYLSVVPTQVSRALDDPVRIRSLAGYDAVLIGGGAADPDLLTRARDAGIAAVTTYGMAETCGGCVYDGRPLGGVGIRVDEVTGRVGVSGPMLFAGYHHDPGRTAAVLADGWFTTADRGRWDGERLQVLGRVDQVVVSGGVNVDLAVVEAAVIATLAGRGEAAVIAVPDTEWGAKVIAVTDTALTRDDLRARLTGALLPREVVVRPELPHTTTGKIDRPRLRALLTQNPRMTEEPHPGSRR